LPSPSVTRLRWLCRKEISELALSPSFALLLMLVCLVVGHEFISSVQTYSEMSGASGGAGALTPGMNPLDGILVPTFGAYDIAATLLLPFVVIRIFSGERATGAWNLLVQSSASVREMVAVKALVLGAAWLLALVPGLVAVLLWKSYGGHVQASELGALLLGHVLRAGLTVAIAAAAAAITPQAATAAIVTLGITIGSWALEFAAATRGGIWATVATFTPTAALRSFEQGLVQSNVVAVMAVTCLAGLAIAVVWLTPGTGLRQRSARSAALAALFVVAAAAASRLHSSWDVTEDRRHSFSEADDARLRSLAGTLKIEIHLGAEDPRLADFHREILDKLERAVPRVEVSYPGAGGTGLFASPDSHYGEIWYELSGQRVMLKSAIEPVVLETIYKLDGIAAAPAAAEEQYRGYPLHSDAPFAAIAFFLAGPLIVVAASWRARRA
jgi:ABC-2 type transport system permease protein